MALNHKLPPLSRSTWLKGQYCYTRKDGRCPMVGFGPMALWQAHLKHLKIYWWTTSWPNSIQKFCRIISKTNSGHSYKNSWWKFWMTSSVNLEDLGSKIGCLASISKDAKWIRPRTRIIFEESMNGVNWVNVTGHTELSDTVNYR